VDHCGGRMGEIDPASVQGYIPPEGITRRFAGGPVSKLNFSLFYK